MPLQINSLSTAFYSSAVITCSMFIHRRSIVERGRCFQRRLFVCLSVCLLVNTISTKRLNIARWNLAFRCIVEKSHQSSNDKLKGQRSRSPGTKKNEKVRRFVFWGAVLVRHFFPERSSGARSCRWGNQRMLSSFDFSSCCRLYSV